MLLKAETLINFAKSSSDEKTWVLKIEKAFSDQSVIKTKADKKLRRNLFIFAFYEYFYRRMKPVVCSLSPSNPRSPPSPFKFELH